MRRVIIVQKAQSGLKSLYFNVIQSTGKTLFYFQIYCCFNIVDLNLEFFL